MKRVIFLLAFLFILFAPKAHAAIAFDNAQGAINVSAVTSTLTTTLSYTATGSNLVGVCFVYAGDGDVLTGITWNGTSFFGNQIAKLQNQARGFFYSFYLINPPVGTTNIVATVSSHVTVERDELYCETVTGASQTTQPDAVASSTTNAASFSKSVTTVADNAWLMMGWEFASLSTVSAGANTTVRVNANTVPGNAGGLTDANTVETPPGSFAQNISWSGAADIAGVAVSIKPFVAAAATTVSYNHLITFDW